MSNNNWKDRLGTVYSTNPDFKYEGSEEQDVETKIPEKQQLRIQLDKRNRGGKQVTLVTGFIGTSDDIEKLGKELKSACGTGGSVKDAEIIIQGDFRQRVLELLQKKGYSKSKII